MSMINRSEWMQYMNNKKVQCMNVTKKYKIWVINTFNQDKKMK